MTRSEQGHAGDNDSDDVQLLKINALGCTLAKLIPPGAHNICLSFRKPADYESTKNPAYFGETIGRVANRISGARLRLNGREYRLAANGDDGQNCLHGGVDGWGKRKWDGPVLERRVDSEGVEREGVQKFTLRSDDGDEGFPGHVLASAWWFAREVDGKAVVEVEYEAQMPHDQPAGVEETVVAMTNHSYFNLSSPSQTDSPSLAGTVFTLPTTQYLEVSHGTNIPTGEMAQLSPNGGIEAGREVVMGESTPVLDHCFVLDAEPANIPLDTRSRPLRQCMSLAHSTSSVHLTVESTEPAFQVYTGDAIDVRCGEKMYGSRAGIAIEPGRYTNAANQPEWRGMVTLRRGQTWGSRIKYTTWKQN